MKKLSYIAPRCEIFELEGNVTLNSISYQEAGNTPIPGGSNTAEDLEGVVNSKRWGNVWENENVTSSPTHKSVWE